MVRPVPSRIGTYAVMGGLGRTESVQYATRGGVGYALHRVARQSPEAAAVLGDYRVRCADAPGLARLVDVLEDGADLALVFELREGVSLARLLAHLALGGESLAEPALWYVTCALGQTLASMHASSPVALRHGPLVHGRVSPNRVLLTWDGDVLLLGACPLVAVELPADGAPRDSEAWLAPEVRRGTRPSAPSDVFSLALLVQALLSGDEEPTSDAANTPLQLVRPDLPVEVALTLDRSLSSEPNARPTSRELVRSLAAMTAREPRGAEALATLIAPLEAVGGLFSNRSSTLARGVDARRAPHDSSSGSLEETFPTMLRGLASGGADASSARPEPTTLPSESAVAPVSGESAARAADEPDIEVAELSGDDLEGTLVMDAVSPYATHVSDPTRSAQARRMGPALPPPPHPLAPSLAPPAAPGLRTVVDDGAPRLTASRPGLPQSPAHLPTLGALPKTRAFAWGSPVSRDPSSAPLPTVDGAASLRPSAWAPPSANAAPRPVKVAALYEPAAARAPDSFRQPPALAAADQDGGATLLFAAPPVPEVAPARGAGGPREAVASSSAPNLTPLAALAPASVGGSVASSPAPSGRERSPARRRSVVGLLVVVVVVVWGGALGLYLRGRDKGREATAEVASPSSENASPAAAPSVAMEADSPSSAAVAAPPPTTGAPSAEVAASPAPDGAPSATASTDIAAARALPVVDAPGADRKLLSFESHLVVRSSIDTNVYMHGVVIGRTNQRMVVRCRWQNLRLGVDPGPFWISKLRVEYLPCMLAHTVTIEPEPELVAAERARTR
ncbi:MAG: hypothetical protein FJ095_17145 [Deltaproteobacteria bacterium]|nr:hypothetical protein [Deltaproteobacteria bacterium]